jgi:hypothetical protein
VSEPLNDDVVEAEIWCGNEQTCVNGPEDHIWSDSCRGRNDPDPKTIKATCAALSGVLLAAAFAIEPGTWPAFTAFVERATGSAPGFTAADLDRAIQITDAVMRGLQSTIGQDGGTPYLRRYAPP